MKNAWLKTKAFLLDLIFPVICINCKKLNDTPLCSQCLRDVRFQRDYTCCFCSVRTEHGVTCKNDRPTHALNQFLVALSYEDSLVKSSIKAFKYQFIKDLAPVLGDLMTDYLRVQLADGLKLNDVVIVPVPLSAKRLRWRGFNQSYILADRIACNLHLAFDSDSLKRNTRGWGIFALEKPQAEITEKAIRMQNLNGRFSASSTIAGKTVLLIDDVSTTGSTLEACAQALHQAGAKKIIGFVLARG